MSDDASYLLCEIKGEIAACSLDNAEERDSLIELLQAFLPRLNALLFEISPDAAYDRFSDLAYETRQDMALGGA